MGVTAQIIRVVTVTFAVAGCQNIQRVQYDAAQVLGQLGLTARHQVERQHNRVLPADSRLYVSAGDGPDAALQIAAGVSLAEALRWQFTHVAVAETLQSRHEALSRAGREGADYLFYPHVLLWDDEIPGWVASTEGADNTRVGVTEWLQSPDRAAVRLSVIDVRGGAVVDTVLLRTRAAWSSLGATDLHALFNTALTRYADSLSLMDPDGGP